MTWPNSIPDDLRRSLQNVLGVRSYGEAEIYSAVKEWLEKHGVEAPETLPERKPFERFCDK